MTSQKIQIFFSFQEYWRHFQNANQKVLDLTFPVELLASTKQCINITWLNFTEDGLITFKEVGLLASVIAEYIIYKNEK